MVPTGRILHQAPVAEVATRTAVSAASGDAAQVAVAMAETLSVGGAGGPTGPQENRCEVKPGKGMSTCVPPVPDDDHREPELQPKLDPSGAGARKGGSGERPGGGTRSSQRGGAHTPARFVGTPAGEIIDRQSVGTTVNAGRQSRHVAGPDYKHGGYFTAISEAQAVLDAFHGGTAEILGLSRTGNIVVRVPSVTGYNNNIAAGYVNQPTDVFFIKGTAKPGVVPANPNWSA